MNRVVIKKVIGREILDSRGNPTVEAEVHLSDGTVGTGAAPSGASTGAFEALELRDGDKKRYLGKGVSKAVHNVNAILNNTLVDKEAWNFYELEHILLETDGKRDKSKLGANAVLATSIAMARAASMSQKIPLHRYLGGVAGRTMPVPMMNILNGGVHALSSGLDVQEFMIMPIGAGSFKEALRWCAEVFHALAALLKERGYATSVGDEGGFAPAITSEEEAIETILVAIQRAGYKAGVEYGYRGMEGDFMIAIDAAASEWKYPHDGSMWDIAGSENETVRKYHQPKSGRDFTTDELIDYWVALCDKYPIISIEDALDEEDWDGWKKLTARLGDYVQLVGDDLFVTNTERLAKGIELRAGTSILIKLNQIGSISETMDAIRMAQNAGYTTIVSHRSGETEDTTIADLAVALNAGQIKTGAPSRSERVAKYNQLLRIEEGLGDLAVYPGIKAFHVKPRG